MFVPCIIRCSRNNQHYALICTTPLFYILAPTCFGSSLPLSGSFLDPSELPEIQIEWIVYHIMCGYVTCVHTVYRIKEWYKSMPIVGHFYYSEMFVCVCVCVYRYGLSG
jgi:hypothetical protein